MKPWSNPPSSFSCKCLLVNYFFWTCSWSFSIYFFFVLSLFMSFLNTRSGAVASKIADFSFGEFKTISTWNFSGISVERKRVEGTGLFLNFLYIYFLFASSKLQCSLILTLNGESLRWSVRKILRRRKPEGDRGKICWTQSNQAPHQFEIMD